MKAQEGNDTFQNGEENKTKRPVGDVLVFEELFVSPSGPDQQHVGGGGMMMSGRRGRHTPETVRLVLHARKKNPWSCQRLIKLPLFFWRCAHV